MNGVVDTVLSGYPLYGFVEFTAEVSIKGLFIIAGAFLLTLFMKRFSAYTRKMVWVAALTGLLILPALTLLTPVWNMPLLPQPGWVISAVDESADLGAVSGKDISGGAGISGTGIESGPATLILQRVDQIHWSGYMMIAWLSGVMVAAVWYLLTVVAMRRITETGTGAGFRLESVARSIAGEMGVSRKYKLKISSRVAAGVTAGIMNPVIILPISSTGWSEEKLRLVLAHEMAHVMRRDGIIELMVNLATLMYWFNPLVWFAARRIRIERERDCDNAVLNRGVKPSQYASLLMGIATDLQSRAKPVLEAAMISQGSRLKDRLMCVLNPSLNRSMGSCRTVIVAGLLLFSMLAPLSLSGIWDIEAGEQKKTEKKLTEEEQKKLEMKKKQMMKKYSNISPAEKVNISWKKIVQSHGDNSAAVKVARVLKKDGRNKAEKVLSKLKKAKKSGDTGIYFKEQEFNTLGYVFLFDKRVDDAIFIFSANVDMYPESWNVYDSLGEVYLVAGKCDKAEKLYRKSMAINPENENGKKMLAKIDKIREMDMARETK